MTSVPSISLEPAPWFGQKATALWRIYDGAFPRHERVGRGLMRLASLRPDTDLLVGTDSRGAVVGLLMTMRRDSGVYALFLAVDQGQRSRGIGSAMLRAMRQYYPGAGFTLAIESVSQRFHNYPERLRRLRFYERNGFCDSGWRVREYSGIYDLLSMGMEVDIADYRAAMKTLEPLSPQIDAVRVQGVRC